MTSKHTKRFVVVPELIGKLVYHDVSKMEREVGPLWKYMDSTLVPETDVTVLVRKVERDPGASNVGPSVHKHDVNQLYCLIGEFELEVTLGAEKHLVKGPASILVPAGMDHAIRFVGGKGYLVNVLSRATYE